MMEYPESVLREGYAISPLRSYASFEVCQRDPLYRVMLDNWAHIYLRRREARRPTGYVSSQGNVQETILKAYRRMAAEQLGARGVPVLDGLTAYRQHQPTDRAARERTPSPRASL